MSSAADTSQSKQAAWLSGAPGPLVGALPTPAAASTLRSALGASGGAPRRLTGSAETVEVWEVPFRGMILLKTDLSHPDVAEAVRAAVGLETPAQRKCVVRGERAALWLAPDELMVMTAHADAAATAALVDEALSGRFRLVVDASDARALFQIKGPGARDLIAKGAPVDMHPAHFGVGDVRRTRFSTMAAAFYQIGAAPDAFELFCFRSYAPDMSAWLVESASVAAAPGVFGPAFNGS